MSGWEFVYDKEFAKVYDVDFENRIDLSWDGERMKVTAEDVVLDIGQVEKLRKLLQSIERRVKKGEKDG